MSERGGQHRWSTEVPIDFLELRRDKDWPVIGRITQLTETRAIPVTRAWFGSRRTALPGGRIVSVTPMYNLYVYRVDGQAHMILTRVDPFQYEHVSLSELEMRLIQDWALGMAIVGVGRFSPSDAGWFWWRK